MRSPRPRGRLEGYGGSGRLLPAPPSARAVVILVAAIGPCCECPVSLAAERSPTLTKIFSLEGKVALVTGASRGLGRAMALALAGCDAHVVVNGRNPAGIEQTR